eukprot:2785162-Pleurochrysis_carterae.AAC.1
MPAIYVLGALVMLRIVCQVDCRLVVHGKRSWLTGFQAEIGEERSQVYRFFCRFRGSDDFCLARRQGD